MKKLVLVDGNAIVHRAYHALPPLNKREDGQLTNAVYGFFSMVLKIVGDLNPDNLIVCFDRAAPTFRKQMYVGYQATRPKMEDELSGQFVIIHEVLEKIGICIFELDGYEADDLIGTLAVQAIDEKMFDQVIILTGDRDMLQLVNHHVLVLAPIVGVTKMILFDEDAVKEKYGLEPHQFVDYKALVGDASDNYPGVSGIGPKTAADLINKYHTLEGIYGNLGEISPKVSEKLAKDAEQSVMAKKLATIEKNVPIHLKPQECLVSEMDRESLLSEFESLSFNSLINRFKLDKTVKVEKPKKSEASKDQLGLL
ncbi:MAG: 5'-3' exonuclease H3TH domain-containing protein [Patescibacteria group bacterium]